MYAATQQAPPVTHLEVPVADVAQGRFEDHASKFELAGLRAGSAPNRHTESILDGGALEGEVGEDGTPSFRWRVLLNRMVTA